MIVAVFSGGVFMIEVGTVLILEMSNKTENQHNRKFRCRIVDYHDSHLVVDYPIDEETKKQSFFLDGTEFHATFVGKDEAVYMLSTEIVGRIKFNVPVLLLKDPGKENYIRIQRRNYVRVEEAVDVVVYPTDNRYEPLRSVTWDLSGGGCAVVLPEDHSFPERGEGKLWIALHMNSGELVYIQTLSKIIRITPIKGNIGKRVSLQFLSISKEESQMIVRYCFEKQLEQRRKNRI